MKKGFKLLLGAVFFASSVAAVLMTAGCSTENTLSHSHTFESEWSNDETYHWHAATCEHKDQIKDRAEHVWDDVSTDVQGNTTYTCTVCGRTKTDIHTHTFSEAWSSSDTYHWHAATCGHTDEIKDGAAHTWDVGKVTTAATETADGVKTFACVVCGKTKTETIPALGHRHTIETRWSSDETYHWHRASCGKAEHNTDKAEHSWYDGVVTKSATETEDGVMTYTCTVCGKTKTEAIPKHSHTFSEAWSSSDTYHWHAATCGHTDEIKDGAEHTWDSGKVTKEATETADGVKTFACTVCGKTKTEAVPRLKHEHTIAAEWSKDSIYHWHEASCGNAEHNTDKAEHSWYNGVVTKAATCTEVGEMTYTCTVCNATKTEVIPATGHSYSKVWSEDDTHHWHECSICKAISDKAEHSWYEKVTKEVACTADGEKQFTCTVCGKTKTETIPATGHTFASEWSSSDTYHWHTATCGCDEIKDGAEHTWNDGKVTTAATEESDGVMTFTCVVCKKTKTEAIPQLKHEHTIAAAWSSDKTYHWHAASCGKAEHSTDKAEHAWYDGVVTKPATEESDGEMTYTCTVCGKTKTETIPKHTHTFSEYWSSSDIYHWHAATCGHTDEIKDGAEHTWDSGKVTKEATEESDGEKIFACTVCGRTKAEAVPRLKHEHTIATEWSKDDIYHWHKASCGKEEHNTDKAEHSWYNGTVTKAATCTEAGVMTYTCTVCNATKTEVIPAIGHSYSKVWSESDTHHWHECSICKAISDKAEHTLNFIVTPPTTDKPGVITFTCTVCHKTEETQVTGNLGDNKVINGAECKKTEEVNICTTSVTVKMEDDSSWSGYVAENADDYNKGVYINGRSVTLSPFAMGKYEVTQELFHAVMGTNPSYFNSSFATGETQGLRPVEKVNWYDAIAFCNKLSIIEGLEPCYSVSGITDWANLAYNDIPTESDTNWNAATCDFTKKGYRLPTEAEWEYAARSGNASAEAWKYAFSGVNVAQGNMVYDKSGYLKTDVNLDAYAWYSNNTGSKTHEVGLKKPNRLGLYDMSGNVYEWCWDWYNATVSAETVTNPTGPASGSYRLRRGGSWLYYAYCCAVSRRNTDDPDECSSRNGFRLARSL